MLGATPCSRGALTSRVACAARSMTSSMAHLRPEKASTRGARTLKGRVDLEMIPFRRLRAQEESDRRCPAFFVAAAGQKLPWLCRFSPCAEPGARCRRASYRSRRPKPSRDASFSLDVLFSHLLRSPPRSSSSTSSLPLKKKKKNSGHRPDLQARQEGLHPLPDRRRAPGPAWRRPGRRSHQLQGAPHPQGIGPRPGDP